MTNESPENTAEVSKILDKRVNNDVTEYLIRWKDKPDSEDSWELESNLKCDNLLKEYEEAESQKNKEHTESEKRKNIIEDNRLRGFDRGLTADKIIGATDATGELLFLVTWKGCDEADLVPARQLNIRCPELVIQFYNAKEPWGKPGKIEEIVLSD